MPEGSRPHSSVFLNSGSLSWRRGLDDVLWPTGTNSNSSEESVLVVCIIQNNKGFRRKRHFKKAVVLFSGAITVHKVGGIAAVLKEGANLNLLDSIWRYKTPMAWIE